MARAGPRPPFSPSPPAPLAVAGSGALYDPYLDLGRLLARLDQNLLRADSDRRRRLVDDEFQRLQARFDVAAARSLLARVEQGQGYGQQADAYGAAAKVPPARRHAVQAELSRQRARIEQLQEWLDDLEEEARAVAAAAAGETDEADSNDDDDNDIGERGDDDLAHILRLQYERSTTENGRGTERDGEPAEAASSRAPDDAATAAATAMQASRSKPSRVRIAPPGEEATAQPPQATPTATVTATATRRRKSSRRKASAASPADGQSQARSTSAQVRDGGEDGEDGDGSSGGPSGANTLASSTHSLLGSRGKEGYDGGGGGAVSEEALLDHHRREQEALSEDILRLARALKEKSLTTSRLLEDDRDVVDRVGEGLNATTDHLTAASRSMAVLTRITEGRGWWGRLLLLGMVYGLMVVLLLLFFFLPKLRL